MPYHCKASYQYTGLLKSCIWCTCMPTILWLRQGKGWGHSISVESSTHECAGRLSVISITLLVHLDHTITVNITQLTASMLMVSASLMDSHQENTSFWTFAAAYDERRSDRIVCPWTKTDTSYMVPPFIGQDYFRICDTGSRYATPARFYHADPLWDGSGCGSTSSCCGFNNPPWFCKQLPQPTTDDIEMRVCVNELSSSEDVALGTVEIYVQWITVAWIDYVLRSINYYKHAKTAIKM